MLKRTVLAAVVLLAGVAPAHADVRLSMHDGLVTIVAKDVTVRQILAEWAKVGRATIVNAERIAGGPITIEFSDVPEKQALDILLRSISGYLAAPRPTMVPDASRFDRIIVLPSAAQPRTASAGSSAPAPLPQPRPFQLQPAPQDLDDSPAPNVNELPPQPVNRFAPAPNQPPTPVTTPTFGAPVAPVGTSTPGQILQPPPQPGQPGQPVPAGQPGQPGRP